MLEEIDKGPRAPEASGSPSMTLGEYLAEAGKALRTSIPQAWVQAIILDAKPMKQGIRIVLVEPSVDEAMDGRRTDQRDGRLDCVIWSRTATAIEQAIGMPLDAASLKGTHVRMLIKTNFSARYHLEGEVRDLDPTVVQGLIERRLEAIRAVLRGEGIYRSQQALPEPEDITSIAVIHPDRSAGWADVEGELERLRALGIVRLVSYSVPFEGAGSASRIAEALDAIQAGAHPDVVLIIRGGGNAAGLASLANVGLARAICRCPVPIITGIGHASDRSIVDELAWRAADTPSKALGVVKSIVRKRCTAAIEDHSAVCECVERMLTATLQPLLTSAYEALAEAVDKVTALQASRLRETAHAIERSIIRCRGSIDLSQSDLDRLAGTLLATAPRVPRSVALGLKSVYVGLIQTARGRLPDPNVLPLEAHRSASVVANFVEQQTAALHNAFAILENAMHRRISDESARLATLSKAAQALDVDATLARGFVLPLDDERCIIRSAKAAQAAGCFELLFVDGSVACRPTIA